MDYKKIMLPLVLLVLLTINISAISAAEVTVTAGSDTATIQGVIDNAAEGDTVNFEAGDYANIDNVNITKKLTITGAGETTKIYGSGDGNSNVIFNVAAGEETEPTGTVIKNIAFYMMQDDTTKANDNGYGIQLVSVKDITIDNCHFYNGSAGVYASRSTNTLISNNYFTGITERITHDGTKEKGAKSINIMGGSNTVIENNTVEGNVLDAISVASNAQYITVKGNTFKNASYSMFYGGGVAHVDIINNTFDHGIADAISLTKSCRDTLIANNSFINIPTNNWGSTIIYSEPGNSAHGYPTTITNITIVDNTFEVAEGENAGEIVAYKIYNLGTGLSTDTEITVANNDYNGVTPFLYFESAWVDGDDIIIAPTAGASNITPGDLSVTFGDNITATLTDSVGNAIAGQHIAVKITDANGNEKTLWATTDYAGQVQIPADLSVGTYTIDYAFAGYDRYNESSATSTVEVTAPEEKVGTTFTIDDFTGVELSGTNLTGVLKDVDGNVLAGQHVVLTLTRTSSDASRSYTTTTDYNGEFQFPIFLGAGNYHASATFAGNDVYSAVTGEKDFQTTKA